MGDNPNSNTGSDRGPSLVGQLVDGKYEVLQEVGQGGMGMVYRAKHVLMGREVALKVLHARLVENDEFSKRFQHEAQVASKLHHPNAVMIYDFGVTARLPYIVMEFVQGDTLKDLIKREGALPAKKIHKIMDQVFSALNEAHKLGIIHRDLKPDNFILTDKPDGTYLARVLDFGIAKLVQTGTSKEQTLMTQVGAFYGTPRYSSPEQALGKELDPRSDIYSLGVILYEALAGEVPFDAPSMMELLLKHLNQPPVSIRKRHPELGVSPLVEAVVMKCLEKDREKRYQTVMELSEALEDAVIRSDQVVKSGSAVPLYIVLGLIAAGLGGGGYYFLTGKEDQIFSSIESTSTPSVFEKDKEAEIATNLLLTDLINVNNTPEPTALATPETAQPSPMPTAEISPTLVSVVETPAPTPGIVSTLDPTLEPTPEAQATDSTVTPEPTLPPVNSPEVTPTVSATPSVAGEDVNALDSVKAYKKAEQLYRARSYVQAIPYYERVIAIDPSYKKARLSLGICFLRLKRMDDAFIQFKKAYDLDRHYPPTLFNLACYYALNGEKDSAIEWLGKAIGNEPAVRRWAVSEPDLVSLKGDPRFTKLIR